ncbi:MAG: ribosome rescue protein RqcH [Halobacteriaceae archaeon]
MERKRELTSVDLVALVSELREYTGAVVDKAYLYGDDLVRLKLRDFDRGRIELLLEVGEVKRGHLVAPEHVPAAPERPPDFAKMLRNRIAGATFASVDQHGFDRILEFEFRREDQDTTIVAELFGEGNVAVLDQSGVVVDCLETVRLSSRTVAPGAPYGFPTERPRPDALDREAFAETMRDSDTDLVRTLATQLDFGGLYGEEVCTRAGVEKTTAIADADDATFDQLYETVTRLFEPLDAGDLDPRVYYEEDQRVDVTPIPLEEYADRECETFDSFNAALDDYFTNLATTEDGAGGASRPAFEEEIEKRERIIAQQEAAIDEFEAAAATERRRAELLYAHYDLVDDILSAVRDALAADRDWTEIEARFEEARDQGLAGADAVTDVDPEAGTVTITLEDEAIELDPDSGVEKNADRLYNAAKDIEDKQAGAEAAIEDTREELAALKDKQAAWSPADASEEDSTSERDWLAEPSIPTRRPDQWFDRFRWFRTTDGFLVIGGRNADQNEELVEKYLDRQDLFFHAQAHGGPATILKTSDPSEPATDVEVPAASLAQAAQFAVTYSSVWKDGKFAGDVYHVDADQVSKTPESGEYLEKGGFAIRGDRSYHRDVAVGCVVGVRCEPDTRVIGGPPPAIEDDVEFGVAVEPGAYAQGDVAKRIYRRFREAFTDTSFVRKVASPDEIQKFLPPGTSRITESVTRES